MVTSSFQFSLPAQSHLLHSSGTRTKSHLPGLGDGATGITIDLFRTPQTSLKHIPPSEVERPAPNPPETVSP